MADPISDAWIERGLTRAVELGALRAWAPVQSDTIRTRRRWLLVHPDGRHETVPAGAAWGFARGARQTAAARP